MKERAEDYLKNALGDQDAEFRIGQWESIEKLVSGKRRLGLGHFSALQVLIGLTGLSTVLFFNQLPSLMLKGFGLTGISYGPVLVLEFLIVLLYVLVPATLMGATFPVIAGVYSKGQFRSFCSIRNQTHFP